MGESTDNILKGFSVGAPLAQGIMEARGIRETAGAESAASRYNARLFRMRGQAQADAIREQGQAELARERVHLANSGLRLEGTPVSFLSQQAYQIEKDAANAETAAMQSARLENAKATATESAGKRQAGAALLSGGIGSAARAVDYGFLRRRT